MKEDGNKQAIGETNLNAVSPRVKRKKDGEKAALDAWMVTNQEKVMGTLQQTGTERDPPPVKVNVEASLVSEDAQCTDAPNPPALKVEVQPKLLRPDFELVAQARIEPSVPGTQIEIVVTTEEVESCKLLQHDQKIQVQGHVHNLESSLIQAIADAVRCFYAKALNIAKPATSLYQHLNVNQASENMQLHWACSIPANVFEPGRAMELEKGLSLLVQLAVDQEVWNEAINDKYPKGSLSSLAVSVARKLRVDRGGQKLPDGTQIESRVLGRPHPLGEAIGPAPAEKESHEDKTFEGKFFGVSRKTWSSDFCVEPGRRWLEPQFKLEQYDNLYKLAKVDADLCTITARIHKLGDKVDHVELLSIGMYQPKLLEA